jgi:hypothetical protein
MDLSGSTADFSLARDPGSMPTPDSGRTADSVTAAGSTSAITVATSTAAGGKIPTAAVSSVEETDFMVAETSTVEVMPRAVAGSVEDKTSIAAVTSTAAATSTAAVIPTAEATSTVEAATVADDGK